MGEYKTRRAADTFDAGVRQLFVGNLHFKATDADFSRRDIFISLEALCELSSLLTPIKTHQRRERSPGSHYRDRLIVQPLPGLESRHARSLGVRTSDK